MRLSDAPATTKKRKEVNSNNEMGHSIIRRMLHKRRLDRPDNLHVHHVIMRSLMIVAGGRISKQWANPLATAIILPLTAVPVTLGLVFNQNNGLCMALFFGFALLFACTHCGIIKATRWYILVAQKPKKNVFNETK